MASFTTTQPGANSDYLRYIFEPPTKQARTNEPTLLDFALLPIDSNMVKLTRGAYITLTTSSYGVWYTGFVTNDSELVPIGKRQGEFVYGYRYEATSDEYILNLKPLGILPPFINQTHGSILRALVALLQPTGFTFNVAGIADGLLLPRYVVDPNKHFTDVVKEFADAANYRFEARNMAITFEPKDAVASPLVIDGNDKHFTPSNLTLQPAGDPVINDAIVLGDVEPQEYMTEYFLGDGVTARFPLISSPFGTDSTLLLDDDFSNSTIDSTKWTVYDKAPTYLQPFNGFMNCVGGANDGNYDVALVSANLVPLDVPLRITHGEYDFVSASDGIIGGLWMDQPSAANLASCVYGLNVFKQGSDTIMRPFVLGTPDGSQSAVIHYDKRYILRTLLVPTHSYRQQAAYSYISKRGEVRNISATQPTDSLSVQTIITEVDPTTAEVTGQVTFTNPSIALSGDQTFAYYVPVVDNDLHLSFTGVTVTSPLQATLRTKIGGGFNWAGSAWAQQIIGSNEIDSFDNLAPVATIIDQATGAATKSSILGTANYNPGQAVLNYFKDSVRLLSTTPQPGDVIELKYRQAGAAIGRVQDRVSIASEATGWGDDGLRSITRRDLSPLPRTSAECEVAASAVVQSGNFQHYTGTYVVNSGSWLTGEPKPGTILKFSNLPTSFPGYLEAEEITSVSTSFDHVAGGEHFTHTVQFGPIDAVAKMLGQMRRTNDVFAPQDSVEIPVAADINSVDTVYAADVVSPVLTGWNSSVFTFDTQQDPPAFGGFEVRYTDESWGADDAKNLVARITTGRAFSVPRNNRGKSFFIKAYDLRNQIKWSESFDKWSQNVTGQLSITSSARKNLDGDTSLISAVQVTNNANNVALYQALPSAPASANGVFSVDVLGPAGATIQTYFDQQGHGPTITATHTLTGRWQRVNVSGTFADGLTVVPLAVIGLSGVPNGGVVYLNRASVELGTLAETIYAKTNGSYYGAQSRFASGVHVSFPAVPAAPIASVDLTDPTKPVVNVTLPNTMQDVWGVEIRAFDNSTVLVREDLASSSFALSYAMPANVARNLSYWVYTYNLLNEYSSGANAAATVPVPAISNLFIDQQAQTAKWVGNAAGLSYTVEFDATSSAMTHVVHSTTQAEPYRYISPTYFFGPLWIRVTPSDTLGTGAAQTISNSGGPELLSGGAVGNWWNGSSGSWFPASGGTSAPANLAPSITSYDNTVNYSNNGLGNSKPLPNRQGQFFYARWTGYFTAPTTGSYTLFVNCSGGVNLYVDGVLVIAQLGSSHALSFDFAGQLGASQTFTAGQSHSFVLEWQSNQVVSGVQLFWVAPGATPNFIPVRFYNSLDDINDGANYRRFQSAVGVKRINVVSKGFSASSSYTFSPGIYIDGALVMTLGSSYNVCVLFRPTMEVVYQNTFAVLTSPSNAVSMAQVLNGLTDQHLVIIAGFDNPQTNRLEGGLPAQMYRIGATRQVFSSSLFKFRSAYLLIGNPGLGQGNGIEKYSGAVDNDPAAICAAQCYVVDGDLIGTSGQLPSNLEIDPTTGDVVIKGSIPPSASSAMSYTSTPNSVTWTWNINVLRTDLGLKVETYSGSLTITGLSAGHTYYFYPYLDEISKTVQWVSGGPGSPGIAFTAPLASYVQTQSRVDHVPLSNGPMTAATTTSGTGGGSAGGAGTCLRDDMVVREFTKGVIPCGQLADGDFIDTPEGWSEVLHVAKRPYELWVEHNFNCGESVVSTPNHGWTTYDDEHATSETLRLTDLISTTMGVTSPESIRVIRRKGVAVSVTVANKRRTLYAGSIRPIVETHNLMLSC